MRKIRLIFFCKIVYKTLQWEKITLPSLGSTEKSKSLKTMLLHQQQETIQNFFLQKPITKTSLFLATFIHNINKHTYSTSCILLSSFVRVYMYYIYIMLVS